VTGLAPTPFTVIGGFLGVGKTTLLNRLLADPAAPRCAVLVNDFGAIDIDASLIREHDGETLALANGCVCCSLASGFIKVMLKVTAERHRFDHVVVEASGVSEPARIMDIARLDPELVPNAIVTVVDAAEFATRLADPATAELVAVQLKAANLVLLNKIDRVDAVRLASIVELIQAHNEDAGVVRTTNADVPLSLVFGTSEVPGSNPVGKRTANRFEHAVHAAADHFHSTSMSSSVPLTRTALGRLDASLAVSVIRAKGIVELEGEPGRWSWQRVGGSSRIEALPSEHAGSSLAAHKPFTAVLIATAPIDPDSLVLPEGVTFAVSP